MFADTETLFAVIGWEMGIEFPPEFTLAARRDLARMMEMA